MVLVSMIRKGRLATRDTREEQRERKTAGEREEKERIKAPGQ